MGAYDEYVDPFKWINRFMIIVVIIFIIMIGGMFYISHTQSSEACEDFGGKLSGQMNCVKNGVSYDMESKSPFSWKMQVVRKAVDINDAFSEKNALVGKGEQ